jgi:hypothetical protein
LRGANASPCVSMRSMLPRKVASVLVGALPMRRSLRGWTAGVLSDERAAGLFVHAMF